MPARTIPLVNEHIYHVYNRGVEKRRIFENRKTYKRFLQTINYYQFEGPKPKFSNFIKFKLFKPDPNKKIVDIISYCLMPNHFHLLIKQVKDGGISEFVRKISDSYTRYYNVKYARIGPLLQGQFKAVLIENNEQLIHVSRYIHLNPISSFLVRDLKDYEWSSYKDYFNGAPDGLCETDTILSLFKSLQDYEQFVLDQVNYVQKLEVLKHQIIDSDEH